MFESTIVTSLIGFFVILTPLIFIHELGHYFAAVNSGVKVEAFSIGFGPELIGFNDKRNTRWKFSLIPLGGYVKMKGELINSLEDQENSAVSVKDTFLKAKLVSRILIVLSGPLANLVLGLILITSIYVFNGRYVSPPIVNSVIKNQPAMLAGLKSGDVIFEINETTVNDFSDIKNIVERSPDQELIINVLRENKIISLNIIPNIFLDQRSKKTVGRIGITAAPMELKKMSVIDALYFGLFDSAKMTLEWFKGLKSMFLLEVNKKEIVGPIGIAKISGSVLDKGFFSIIFLMAVLSINLGLINLLPIPALDGGYLVLFIYESIFKKPVSSKIQLILLKFGFIFLLSLMLLVTAFDLGL
jgi:regulator of sigma E protease